MEDLEQIEWDAALEEFLDLYEEKTGRGLELLEDLKRKRLDSRWGQGIAY